MFCRRFSGHLIYIVGRVVSVSSCVIFVAGLCFFLTSLSITIFISTIAFGGALLGLKAQLLGKRLKMRSATEVLENDPRAPIVYLRSFTADYASTQFSETSIFGYLLRSVLGGYPNPPFAGFWALFRAIPAFIRLLMVPAQTEEEQLVRALRSVGPTVAMADPDDHLPPVGIPRLKFSASEWQEAVSTLLTKAQLVLVRCGSGNTDDGYWPSDRSDRLHGALGWEFQQSTRLVPPRKLVLLVTLDDLEYETFIGKAVRLFPKGLPAYSSGRYQTASIRALISFDAEWNPQINPVTWVDTSWRFDTRWSLASSLQNKFRALLSEQSAPLDTKNIVRRIAAAFFDIALVVGILLPPFLWNQSLLSARMGPQVGMPIALLSFGIGVLLIMCFYLSILESSALMATYGKRLFGLMVTDVCGNRITFRSAFCRSITKCTGIQLLFPRSFLRERRFLHERWTKTKVQSGALRTIEPPRLPFVVSEIGLWVFALAAPSMILVGSVLQKIPTQTILRGHATATHRSTSEIVHNVQFPKNKDAVELDFKSIDNRIVLPMTIGQAKLSFLLDSAAGITQIDKRTAEGLGLKGMPMIVTLLNGTVRHAELVHADLYAETIVLKGQAMAASDLAIFDKDLGIHIDGIIGYDLLKQTVLKIDYVQDKITIFNPISFSFTGVAKPLHLDVIQGVPRVAAKIKIRGQAPVEDSFWLNSATKFGVNHPAILKSKTVAMVKGAVDTSGTKATGTLQYVELGESKVFGVPSYCCSGYPTVDRQIGSLLLRRFSVTFDFQHSQLFLERLK